MDTLVQTILNSHQKPIRAIFRRRDSLRNIQNVYDEMHYSDVDSEVSATELYDRHFFNDFKISSIIRR